MYKWLFIPFILLLTSFAFAQEAQEQKSIVDSSKIHSPRRAATLSLMLPGAGQVYNHRAMPKGKKNAWWKVPLIYAGLGATSYLAVNNHILQRDLKREYIYRADNDGASDPDIDLGDYQQYDQQGILQLHQDHKRSRDMMFIGFLAVFGLNILDALVEAHFVDFDVSPDLSLSVSPVMQDQRTPGVALTFNFR